MNGNLRPLSGMKPAYTGRDYAGELAGAELELREYARNSFLRDNHVKYRRYCEEWLAGLTPEQWQGIRIWKYYEETGNLKK